MANSSSRCLPSKNTQYISETFQTRQSPNRRSAQVAAASITLVRRRHRVVASEPDYDSVHSRVPFHQSCTVVTILSHHPESLGATRTSQLKFEFFFYRFEPGAAFKSFDSASSLFPAFSPCALRRLAASPVFASPGLSRPSQFGSWSLNVH